MDVEEFIEESTANLPISATLLRFDFQRLIKKMQAKLQAMALVTSCHRVVGAVAVDTTEIFMI